MLSVDEKKAIINYRIQKSYGNLNEAKEVAKLGFWNLVVADGADADGKRRAHFFDGYCPL